MIIGKPLPVEMNIEGHRFKEGSLEAVTVPVSAEYAFTLCINGSPYVKIACYGAELDVLATGHFFSLGIIKHPDEIRDVLVDYNERRIDVATVESDEILQRLFRLKTIVSGCGNAGGDDDLPLPPEQKRKFSITSERVCKIMIGFLGHSDTHGRTHGVHGAALYHADGKMEVFFEEIGRHNAVDKLLGYALAQKLSLEDCMVVSTGRISSEITVKAIMVGIPAIVSRSAPTTRAIELARRYGMLLASGVRPSRFFVTSGVELLQSIDKK